MNNKNKINIHERLGIIETKIGRIEQDILGIKDNHLKAIYGKIEQIEKKLNARPTWLITGLVSLLIGLVIYLLTK